MDAKRFGTFLALRRREKGMTQAALAEKIHVTDKAVSRWERGVGFPDISTLEPLADALDVSVLELMRAEKLTETSIPQEEAAAAVRDTLATAREQRSKARQQALALLAGVVVTDLVILLLDTLRLEGGALILWGAGVLFPLLCLSGALALLGLALWRLFRGGPWKHAALLALGLILPLAIFLGFFVLAGALGLGPVPS